MKVNRFDSTINIVLSAFLKKWEVDIQLTNINWVSVVYTHLIFKEFLGLNFKYIREQFFVRLKY